MINRFLTGARICTCALLFMSSGTLAYAQSLLSLTTTTQTPTVMTTIASGTFEVELTPQAPDEASGDSSLGRMTIDKQFFGDLEAHSVGQMLTAMTATEGSAGYVAIERVSGAHSCFSTAAQWRAVLNNKQLAWYQILVRVNWWASQEK